MHFHLNSDIRPLRLFVGVCLTSVLAACSTFIWPPWVAGIQPGESTSPTKAPLRPSAKAIPPGPEVPPSQARWFGVWSGWVGPDRVGDTKLVISQIGPTEVSLMYSYGNPDGDAGYYNVKGHFVDDELTATLKSGSILNYRMRRSGEIEMGFRSYKGFVRYGILAKVSALAGIPDATADQSAWQDAIPLAGYWLVKVAGSDRLRAMELAADAQNGLQVTYGWAEPKGALELVNATVSKDGTLSLSTPANSRIVVKPGGDHTLSGDFTYADGRVVRVSFQRQK